MVIGCEIADFAPRHTIPQLVQEAPEAGLFEMAISRQCVRNAFALHHDKAGTIDHTPGFIRTLHEQLPCGIVKRGVDVNNLHVWARLYSANELNDCSTMYVQGACQEHNQFSKDVIGGNESLALLPG